MLVLLGHRLSYRMVIVNKWRGKRARVASHPTEVRSALTKRENMVGHQVSGQRRALKNGVKRKQEFL